MQIWLPKTFAALIERVADDFAGDIELAGQQSAIVSDKKNVKWNKHRKNLKKLKAKEKTERKTFRETDQATTIAKQLNNSN